MNKSPYEDLYQFCIIHGRDLCGKIIVFHEDRLKGTEIQISKNIHICTVIDYPLDGNPIQKVVSNNEVHFLVVKTYKKWISKIEKLVEHIKTNYNELPDYILYLDGYDTMILNDILNPREMLDFYKCKILFSTEPYYVGTGYVSPTASYLKGYHECRTNYINLNMEKYGSPMDFGINAGVFLGEKKYLLNILEEALILMNDDILKEFPYGCTDDQYVLRYLHNKHFDIIGGDVFNKFFFWGGDFSFTNIPGEEKYHIGYSNKYMETYLNKEK